jgi:hypothetical protein
MLQIDELSPDNAKPLDYLKKRYNKIVKDYWKEAPLVASPQDYPDPYLRLGCHPDVVERIWKGLGNALPKDGRCLVCGTPALLHPTTGALLAFAIGTSYVLRIPKEDIKQAMGLGWKEQTTWAGGKVTNTSLELGEGWLFGRYLEDEITWLRKIHRLLEDDRQPK